MTNLSETIIRKDKCVCGHKEFERFDNSYRQYLWCTFCKKPHIEKNGKLVTKYELEEKYIENNQASLEKNNK